MWQWRHGCGAVLELYGQLRSMKGWALSLLSTLATELIKFWAYCWLRPLSWAIPYSVFCPNKNSFFCSQNLGRIFFHTKKITLNFWMVGAADRSNLCTRTRNWVVQRTHSAHFFAIRGRQSYIIRHKITIFFLLYKDNILCQICLAGTKGKLLCLVLWHKIPVCILVAIYYSEILCQLL